MLVRICVGLNFQILGVANAHVKCSQKLMVQCTHSRFDYKAVYITVALPYLCAQVFKIFLLFALINKVPNNLNPKCLKSELAWRLGYETKFSGQLASSS